MTIGRVPLGYCGNSFPALSEQEGLKILKDCFGDTPESTLLRALNQSKVNNCYNVEVAFNWLLDNNCGQSPNSKTSTPTAKTSNSGFKAPDFCASTKKESHPASSLPKDDDMQRAIEASLETAGVFGGQISAEEQELSKVIEASIVENKKGSDLNFSSFLLDTAEPQERMREGVAPVGLLNVGNTCWFSAVVQAFYHLPSFRRWIYELKFDDSVEKISSAAKIEKEAEFVIELRRLFGFLAGSRRKYVDPSRAVDVLRRQESLKLRNGDFDNQQDVSEFTHLVLEWAEEAFIKRVKRRSKGSPSQNVSKNSAADSGTPENLVQELFYGSLLVECRERDLGREERFSQYPLQVAGFNNLPDSLESSMSPSDGDEASGSNQRWLRTLPPALIFELNRFRFNQGDKASEKIHSRFTFPDAFFADRYLYENRQLVAEKRQLVKRLKQRLKSSRDCLRSFDEFGGENAPKVSLLDSLNCVLYFCRTMKRSDHLLTDSFNDSGVSVTGSVAGGETNGDCQMPVETIFPEFERADEQISTTENFLDDCRVRLEGRIADLKAQIAEIELQIESAFEDQRLKLNGYVLHAVLVHEGQAATGHYFLYLRDFRAGIWKKFNDVQVTDTTWDELERDCYGGYQNTSAYCLFYIRADRSDLQSDVGEARTVEEALGSLPEDLRASVERDNDCFVRELGAGVGEGPSPDGSRAEEALPRSPGAAGSASSKTPVDDELDRLIAQNLELSAHFCAEVKFDDATATAEDDLEMLNTATRTAIARFDKFVENPDWSRDSRVLNVAVYAVGCQHPARSERVVRSIFCEILLRQLERIDSNEPSVRRRQTLEKIRSGFNLTEEEQNLISEIHRSFHAFCSSVLLISFAIENYFDEKYTKALQYVIIAENFAAKLQVPFFRGLQLDFVKICSVKILEKWSQNRCEFYMSSTSETDLKEFLSDYDRLFLPTLNKFLMEESQSNCAKMAEDARLSWMTVLQDETKILQIRADFRPSLSNLASKLGSLPNPSLNSPAMTAKCTFAPSVADRFVNCVRKASSEWNFRST